MTEWRYTKAEPTPDELPDPDADTGCGDAFTSVCCSAYPISLAILFALSWMTRKLFQVRKKLIQQEKSTSNFLAGTITDIKKYNYCLSPVEIAQEWENVQQLKCIRLYINLVEVEGTRFLFGGPEYKGPIISEFVRNALFLTQEVTKYLIQQEKSIQ